MVNFDCQIDWIEKWPWVCLWKHFHRNDPIAPHLMREWTPSIMNSYYNALLGDAEKKEMKIDRRSRSVGTYLGGGVSVDRLLLCFLFTMQWRACPHTSTIKMLRSTEPCSELSTLKPSTKINISSIWFCQCFYMVVRKVTNILFVRVKSSFTLTVNLWP